MQPAPYLVSASPAPRNDTRRHLTEADAVDVWIARWLRIRRADLCRRYRCDPRRLYEIWDGSKFPAARKKAWEQFSERYPSLVDRIDSGHHQRISRANHPDQLALFSDENTR